MYKKIIILLFVLNSFVAFSQKNSEQFPVFPNCEKLQTTELENCFNNEVENFVFNNFKVPEKLSTNYRGVVNVLFEVDENGNFKVQYVDANDETLVAESKRVFAKLPKISPPTFNGIPTYSKYTFKISIPLQNPADKVNLKTDTNPTETLATTSTGNKIDKNKELVEFDSIIYKKFENPQFKSNLNIPFSHSYYSQFDGALNQVGSNNHTASKPYTYAEVSKYYNLTAENEKLLKNKRID